MIPRKLSLVNKIRSKLFSLSLKETDRIKLGKKATANMVQRIKKTNGEAHERIENAVLLSEGRRRDRRKTYGVSYHAGLAATNKALGVDLAKLIRKIKAEKGSILEVGCGAGKTISELKTLFPKATFSATGISLEKNWMKNKNYQEIDWHVSHLGQLKKVLQGKKYHLVYSSLGITNARSKVTQEQALFDLHELLLPKGLFLFNVPVSAETETRKSLQKTGFRVLRGKKETVPKDNELTYSREGEYFVFIAQKQ